MNGIQVGFYLEGQSHPIVVGLENRYWYFASAADLAQYILLLEQALDAHIEDDRLSNGQGLVRREAYQKMLTLRRAAQQRRVEVGCAC